MIAGEATEEGQRYICQELKQRSSKYSAQNAHNSEVAFLQSVVLRTSVGKTDTRGFLHPLFAIPAIGQTSWLNTVLL